MLQRLKKNWFHLFIWAIMITYFFLGPDVYTRYALSEGKPVNISIELPPTTDQIKTSVDRLDSITIKGQDVFNLWGWAFFLGDSDQAAYERYIVLRSEKTVYFYPTEILNRPELSLAFKDIGFDVSNAGFSTFISQEVIHPGTYQIGIMFKHQSSGTTYYANSSKVLIGTPNTLSMRVGMPTEPNTLSTNISGVKPSELEQDIPEVTDQIRYAVDRLDLITSNENSLYNLWGWAFYLGDPNQSVYERYIILQSDTKTLSFLTQPFERPDLQKAFPNINIDIRNTGFSTNLSPDEIPEGVYSIGILFQSITKGTQYFIVTNKVISRSTESIQLELANK